MEWWLTHPYTSSCAAQLLFELSSPIIIIESHRPTLILVQFLHGPDLYLVGSTYLVLCPLLIVTRSRKVSPWLPPLPLLSVDRHSLLSNFLLDARMPLLFRAGLS